MHEEEDIIAFALEPSSPISDFHIHLAVYVLADTHMQRSKTGPISKGSVSKELVSSLGRIISLSWVYLQAKRYPAIASACI